MIEVRSGVPSGLGGGDALAKLLDGDRSIPAGRVENDEMIVIADGDAAGPQDG